MSDISKLIQYGQVSSIQPEACTARVVFPDRSDLVSAELPILVRGSLKTKDYWMPSVGEQVACCFPPNGSDGFILGCFFSKEDLPPVTNENKRHIAFEDGTVIEYDSKEKKLSIEAVGTMGISINDGSIKIEMEDSINIEVKESVTLNAKDSITIDGAENVTVTAKEKIELNAPEGVFANGLKIE